MWIIREKKKARLPRPDKSGLAMTGKKRLPRPSQTVSQ